MRLAILFLPLTGWAATVGPTDRFIPLVLDGGGWSTRVSITNLSDKTSTVMASFLTDKGFNENWKLELKTTLGRISGSSVDATLAPGATVIIESSGAALTAARGFAEVVELADQPIGVQATLVRRNGEQPVQSFALALAPGNEHRAVMALDLRDPARTTELVWVSLTSSVVLELVFRGLAGETVLTGKVDLEGRAQATVRPLERWPELAGFRGTVQWRVTFPFADRYEARTLSGLQLVMGVDSQPWTVMNSMTLPADQASTSPY